MKSYVAQALLIMALATFAVAQVAEAKPFRRALVIGGGGMTPGVALGMIAGAHAAGYEPDVIITSCGASLGASLYHAFGNESRALAYAKSDTFYRTLKSVMSLNSWTVFPLKRRFEFVRAHPDLLPDLFSDTLINVPDVAPSLLPIEDFPTEPSAAKFIVLAARMKYGAQDAGRPRGPNSTIQQVFITDLGTSAYLTGRKSHVAYTFPDSFIDSETKTITGLRMSQATRASITDPYYINPARIAGRYYVGGAVDLFPLATATDLADHVLANFPLANYADHEDLAVSSVFGFHQSTRARLAAQHTDVMWIDSFGTNALAMDPTVNGIFIIDRIPADLAKFRAAIDKQYQFGYERAKEAVVIQRNRVNVRTHLRYTGLESR